MRQRKKGDFNNIEASPSPQDNNDDNDVISVVGSLMQVQMESPVKMVKASMMMQQSDDDNTD